MEGAFAYRRELYVLQAQVENRGGQGAGESASQALVQREANANVRQDSDIPDLAQVPSPGEIGVTL